MGDAWQNFFSVDGADRFYKIIHGCALISAVPFFRQVLLFGEVLLLGSWE